MSEHLIIKNRYSAMSQIPSTSWIAYVLGLQMQMHLPEEKQHLLKGNLAALEYGYSVGCASKKERLESAPVYFP